MENPIESLSRALAEQVQQWSSRVVRVEARRRPATGILLDGEGHVLAAHHTIEWDEDLRVSWDGERTVPAELLGRDAATDLALLRLETPPPAAPQPAPEATDPQVGHLVLALGRPGRTVRAALGIVTARADGWRNPAGARLERYLEADVRLPPGFSGGPVVDGTGRLVGLATTGLLRGAVMIVPAQTLRTVAETLRAKGHFRRGYLGIGSHPVRLQGHSRTQAGVEQGLLIFSVEPGGPAERDGLLLGDVLLSLDGTPTPTLEELLEALTEDRIGQRVPARVLRAGEVRDLELTIGERR